MPKYILKNISKMDINLGDLTYRIPAGQSRNLLSKSAGLKPEDVEISKNSGSISKRLGTSLIEIKESVSVPRGPLMVIDKPKAYVRFPQRTKSYITVDIGEIAEEDLKNATVDEDDALLKQLEEESGFMANGEGRVPIIAKREDDKA